MNNKNSFTTLLATFVTITSITFATANAETLPATTAFNQANAQNNEMFQRLWALKVAKEAGSDAAQAGVSIADGKVTKSNVLRQASESVFERFPATGSCQSKAECKGQNAGCVQRPKASLTQCHLRRLC